MSATARVLKLVQETYRPSALMASSRPSTGASWVPVGSRLSGEYVSDLRLPAGAMISLIVRDDESLVPESTTRLRTGDRLLVVTTAAARSAAERRLRAVSRRGVLAGWFGEDGRPD